MSEANNEMKIRNFANKLKEIAVPDIGVYDAIIDGELIREIPCRAVMVTAESDLANLPDYQPGTLAFTAGFATMWQKDAEGTWQEV